MLTIVHDYSDFCGSNFLTVGMVSARQRLKFEADQRPGRSIYVVNLTIQKLDMFNNMSSLWEKD